MRWETVDVFFFFKKLVHRKKFEQDSIDWFIKCRNVHKNAEEWGQTADLNLLLDAWLTCWKLWKDGWTDLSTFYLMRITFFFFLSLNDFFFPYTVIATLSNFVSLFRKAHQENCKQAELDRKKAEKEREMEKSKTPTQNSKDVNFWPLAFQMIFVSLWSCDFFTIFIKCFSTRNWRNQV